MSPYSPALLCYFESNPTHPVISPVGLRIISKKKKNPQYYKRT